MSAEKRAKIVSFLREKITHAPHKVQMYVCSDRTGKPYPNRNVFERLRKYAQDFLSGDTQNRLLILSGLRGAGKTTVFAQVFNTLDNLPDTHKLFISLDEVHALGLSWMDVLSVYEKEILGTPLESLDTPAFLFLDEVQYDENWAVTIKTIYDRTNKVCVFATGSSALALQGRRVGADIARRAQYERLFPMSFTEYLKIKYNKSEQDGFADSIRATFANATSAEDLFRKMQKISTDAKQYLASVDTEKIMSYLTKGSLPFVLSEQNEQRMYERIKQVINKVVREDIATIGGFERGTIEKIPELLYTIANGDNVVVENVSRDIGVARPVVTKVLKTLEQTETLLRIRPYGSASSQVRKPSKYSFIASSVRATMLHTFGSTLSEEIYKGKLLEDAVALCLHRIFDQSLTYDSSQGGADFVVNKKKGTVVIEVGFGDKGVRQVQETMRSIRKDCFGVVVSSTPLQINEEKTIVHIPVELFLLM